MASLIDVKDCPCDGCEAKPCGHPARCVKFALWLNKTVDAVEAVRCKDCKRLNVLNRKEIYAHCPRTNTVFRPFDIDTREHFCSYGERKDND